MSLNFEAVEKVLKQIFGRDVEKNDLIKYTTINDLILGKGQCDPPKHRSHWSKGIFLQARYWLSLDKSRNAIIEIIIKKEDKQCVQAISPKSTS